MPIHRTHPVWRSAANTAHLEMPGVAASLHDLRTMTTLVVRPVQCPYCKISFADHPWAAARYPAVQCANCRNYAESLRPATSEGDRG